MPCPVFWYDALSSMKNSQQPDIYYKIVWPAVYSISLLDFFGGLPQRKIQLLLSCTRFGFGGQDRARQTPREQRTCARRPRKHVALVMASLPSTEPQTLEVALRGFARIIHPGKAVTHRKLYFEDGVIRGGAWRRQVSKVLAGVARGWGE